MINSTKYRRLFVQLIFFGVRTRVSQGAVRRSPKGSRERTLYRKKKKRKVLRISKALRSRKLESPHHTASCFLRKKNHVYIDKGLIIMYLMLNTRWKAIYPGGDIDCAGTKHVVGEDHLVFGANAVTRKTTTSHADRSICLRLISINEICILLHKDLELYYNDLVMDINFHINFLERGQIPYSCGYWWRISSLPIVYCSRNLVRTVVIYYLPDFCCKVPNVEWI